jgi:hypothetical protein
MSGVPKPFHVPLCDWNSLPWLTGREAPSPQINMSGGTWQWQPPSGLGMLSQWQIDENTISKSQTHEPPELFQDGSDRETGHQKFWEASLLSRPAATQWIQIQRLSLKSRRGFPYIPWSRLQISGGEVQLIQFMVTYYFIGHFNLWGEVTLLWSHPRCYVTFLKSVFACLFVSLLHSLSLIISFIVFIKSLHSPCLPAT